MRLTEEEYNQYLAIHPKLIYYVGQRENLIPKGVSMDEFMHYSVEDKFPIRNRMYEKIHLLEEYIKEQSDQITEEEKKIIRDFKGFRKGTFQVVKLTRKYALFLGDKYVYGVHALNDPFQNFFGNNLPVMVEAVLLPYKGKIIYDGMLSGFPVSFGRGIRDSIKNDLALAEGKYGIITELPERVEQLDEDNSLENQLLVMMKTKSSREYNWYEIEALLDSHPKLMPIYIREWGRINSRKKKKELKELEIKGVYYAMYNDTIVAGNKSKMELEKEIKRLIPKKDKRDSIYYFKV